MICTLRVTHPTLIYPRMEKVVRCGADADADDDADGGDIVEVVKSVEAHRRPETTTDAALGSCAQCPLVAG